MEIVEKLDQNLGAMSNLALCYVFQVGLKYDVFRKIIGLNSRSELFEEVAVSNKEYLKRLIDTYISLGILEEEGPKLNMRGFDYRFFMSPEDVGRLLPEWVEILEELYKMAGYAFISKEHPKILMDFDKGADFWDMRLLMEPYRLGRRAVSEILKLRDGMRVLDLGCGSVSPIEIGEQVGPNGKYLGVDFSPGLLSIASTRVKNSRMDWVYLKEMDIRKLVPKTSYDAVIMSFVLHYFQDPGAVVARTMQMLEPGGKLLIIEPFRDEFPNVVALGFFESLTPEFVRFPTVHDVINSIEQVPYDVQVERMGKSIIVVTLLG
ncbi:class I SAM-dependent methyltransferase [Thermococcus sp.]